MRALLSQFIRGVLTLPHDVFVRLYDTYLHYYGAAGVVVLNRYLRLVLAANVALNLVTLLHFGELLAHENRGSWLALLLLLNYLCWSKVQALRRVLMLHASRQNSSGREQ
ncbi:hypothetical protein SAMN06265795_1086 [Noviherbaspirillum humi]|uniref:Uncharacterized protein n=1 Tax=Noviherbaspirillum humi TaxID=1688639 RepID=A0A239HXZ4_9BURK|nr:hypothetical protein [Noviherbaspirillum humi]SNS86141.1 hypothetical protein SAMN06265795_1086 [Noviherbaspirillum humi]